MEQERFGQSALKSQENDNNGSVPEKLIYSGIGTIGTA
jgi:hypothetical protein